MQHMTRMTLLFLVAAASACSAEAKAPAASSTSAPAAPTPAPPAPSATQAGPALDITVKNIDGKDVALSSYRGQVVLIVNVASECGYTPQYSELQKLHAAYQQKGFSVLGFPSNDFGGQEPNDDAAIKKFAASEYGVTFPMFSKVHATGNDISPLYKALTSTPAMQGAVKWNFSKFLVGKDGRVVARFPSDTTPNDPKLLAAIDRALAAP